MPGSLLEKTPRTQAEAGLILRLSEASPILSRFHVRGVAQSGRALGLGPRSRRFESCFPDHLFLQRTPAGFAFLILRLFRPIFRVSYDAPSCQKPDNTDREPHLQHKFSVHSPFSAPFGPCCILYGGHSLQPVELKSFERPNHRPLCVLSGHHSLLKANFFIARLRNPGSSTFE